MKPKFNLGDEVFTYVLQAQKGECPHCHHVSYDCKDPAIKIYRDKIISIHLYTNKDFGEHIEYGLDGRSQRDGDDVFATEEEAKIAAQKRIEQGRNCLDK
jgi:hypothetical protein